MCDLNLNFNLCLRIFAYIKNGDYLSCHAPSHNVTLFWRLSFTYAWENDCGVIPSHCSKDVPTTPIALIRLTVIPASPLWPKPRSHGASQFFTTFNRSLSTPHFKQMLYLLWWWFHSSRSRGCKEKKKKNALQRNLKKAISKGTRHIWVIHRNQQMFIHSIRFIPFEQQALICLL